MWIGTDVGEGFWGDVPSCMEDLVKLPGVGRKTANVILAIIFHQSALAVDTHVFRVSHRLGLVSASCTTPYSVEVALRRYIPDSQTIVAHFGYFITDAMFVRLRRLIA